MENQTQKPTARSAVLADFRTFTVFFILYKALLLLIALLSPGAGYDTSTSLIAGAKLDRLSTSPVKLARWDAIYFLQAARRGYVFEQEWAFSRVHSFLIHQISQLAGAWSSGQPTHEFDHLAFWGTVLSHVAHYASVVVLYFLTSAVFKEHRSRATLSLASSLLHIITPAGAFFSAPYSEAAFSFLNFSGSYAYIAALRQEEKNCLLKRDLRFLLAGASFALATCVRSNGLLSGCLFAYDFVSDVLLAMKTGQIKLRRLSVLVIGGSAISVGFALPQFIAFRQFCHAATQPRPWCHALIPSIYQFVQGHYWYDFPFVA
ncbi:vacuolar transporter chaperone [Ascosphaera pollenicola]|nr:vacuolar transporter chaperone [Ascosphaera pollenicola]